MAIRPCTALRSTLLSVCPWSLLVSSVLVQTLRFLATANDLPSLVIMSSSSVSLTTLHWSSGMLLWFPSRLFGPQQNEIKRRRRDLSLEPTVAL
eukprot:8703874-Pyramimonas_sp.AAC.1